MISVIDEDHFGSLIRKEEFNFLLRPSDWIYCLIEWQNITNLAIKTRWVKLYAKILYCMISVILFSTHIEHFALYFM